MLESTSQEIIDTKKKALHKTQDQQTVHERENELHSVFKALDENADGFISASKIKDSLTNLGLLSDDPRFKELYKKLKRKNETENYNETEFYELLGENKRFLLRAFEEILKRPLRAFKELFKNKGLPTVVDPPGPSRNSNSSF